MGTKVNSNYEDIINFVRASSTNNTGAMALRPVSYGAELVTNGDGSTTTGWNEAYPSNTTLSVSSGLLRATADAAGAYGVSQPLSLEVGKLYRIVATINVDNASGGTGNLRISDLSSLGGSPTTIATTTGTHYFNFIATDATTYIGIVDTASTAGEYVEFDSISVKEVLFDQPDGTLTLFPHPENVPRVEYDADGNRLGLLVEEQRVNKVTYSEDLSQGSQVNNPTITTNIATAPDGTETVDGIQDTSGGNFKRVRLFSGAVSANSTYTGSLFVKKETVETNYGGIVLSFTAGTGNRSCYGIIDAVNGTISPATANNITATFTVTDVGDFWRFSITGTDTGSNTQLEFGVYGTLSVNGSTVGTGAGSVRRVWGAQLEQASFPTSYIKNEGTSSGVTRSADVASIPVADFGYNQRSGSFFVEWSHTDVGNGDSNYLLHANTNARFAYNNSGGSDWYNYDGVTSINYGALAADGTPIKLATAMNKDGTEAAVDGVARPSSTATPQDNVALSETLYIGTTGGGGVELNGHIKSIKYYPRALTAAQLQEITS